MSEMPVSKEVSQVRSSERHAMEDRLNSVLSEDEFRVLMSSLGFQQGRRGTHWNQDKSAWLYIKRQYEASSEEEARQKIEVLKLLTSRGILHPDTRWGAFLRGDGVFQVFGLSPTLESVNSTSGNEMREPFFDEDAMTKILGHSPTTQERQTLLLHHPDSHINRWIQRIEAGLDPKTGPVHPLGQLLNDAEALYTDNWGRDPKTGKLYPIDIEVIDLSSVSDPSIMRTWIEEYHQLPENAP